MNRFVSALLAGAVLTLVAPLMQQSAEHYLDQFIDKSANPRQDFWQYSVGKWLKEHPIPKSERSWGVANVIQEETYQRLLDISKAAAREAARARNERAEDRRLLGGGDGHRRRSRSRALTPLAAEFARIAAVKTSPTCWPTVARLQYIGVGALYGLAIYQDEKNSDRYAVHLYQGGLGLPDRDYYFDTDDRAEDAAPRVRRARRPHVPAARRRQRARARRTRTP